jgi:hypothetical protein
LIRCICFAFSLPLIRYGGLTSTLFWVFSFVLHDWLFLKAVHFSIVRPISQMSTIPLSAVNHFLRSAFATIRCVFVDRFAAAVRELPQKCALGVLDSETLKAASPFIALAMPKPTTAGFWKVFAIADEKVPSIRQTNSASSPEESVNHITTATTNNGGGRDCHER